MEYLMHFIDIFLHLDKYLNEIISQFGIWTYLILFLIIFAETGLVVTPILPGDSLLFAAGTFCAMGLLDIGSLLLILIIAAILGDTLNYTIGRFIGKKAFEKNYRYIKKEYLVQTQEFYDKHGGKTIIYARFIPIIRTFAPFVAGIGTMKYKKFIAYNVFGGIFWVAAFLMLGYYFGNLPIVKKSFTIVILAIVILSVLPPFIQYLIQKRKLKKQASLK